MVDRREDPRTLTKKGEVSKGISVSYTNVDGLLSKRLECVDYLRSVKPDIMCIVETKLRPSMEMNWFEEGQYRLWRADRVNKGGGGVMVMIRKELSVKKVDFGSDGEEVISIVVSAGNKDFNIVTVYVPPRTRSWNGEQYNNMLRSTLDRLKNEAAKKERMVMVGDFNCKEVLWEDFEVKDGNEWGKEILKMMMENLMTQWVRLPTRCRGDDTPARLDLVFTKDVKLEDEVEHVCPLGRSDHDVLKFSLDVEKDAEINKEYMEDRLNYARADYDGLRKFFGEVDWFTMYNEKNIQMKYDQFMEVYNRAVEKFVPYYSKKTLGKSPWFDRRCIEAKRNKERAWKRFKKRGEEWEREAYKVAKNRYVEVRRQAQKEYEKRIVEKCDCDPKMFYKFVNGKLKKKEAVERVRLGDEIFENDKDIAEILNKSFCKVFTVEEVFDKQEVDVRKMRSIIVTRGDIETIVNNIDGSKSMGPDGISGRLLKECKDELIDVILDIVSTSLETGKVPKEWKRAEVIPIYKSGNRTEPLNYRPVSLTSILCKICEEVIKLKWTEYLESENILNERQFGFRKGKSCVTNLLCFYSRVVDVVQERDGWVDCIYLDLKKAFDKVPHQRLMWKLRNVGGVSGRLEEWMKDYLMEREMRTIVKGKKSEWRNVTSGVPQGSVLGPIMFLIYVNDMTAGLRSYMNMFADDAKIMRRVKNMEDCDKLQEDIDRIFEWSKDWQMEFNINKCHIMRMGKSKYRPCKEYKLGEDKIEEVSEERDLGVIIQNNLSPEKHINKLFGKTYSMLQSIGLSFHYLDEEMMKKILTTLIRPQLEYAAVIWSPYMKKHVKKIERIQRLGTRMIPGFKEIPYEERLKELELVTLEERRTRGDMITIYKIVNKIDILDREDLIKIDPSNYLRGHERRIKKDACTSDVKKYSFPHRGIEVWNGLRGEIVNATSVSQMKEHFDKCGQGDRT